MELEMSSLPKTWIIDIDGTILKHNGYKQGKDEVLRGVKKFFLEIPSSDKIILLTAREKREMNSTLEVLKINEIRYDKIIFDIPVGERILINDMKPSGLKTAYSINLKRDYGFNDISIKINEGI